MRECSGSVRIGLQERRLGDTRLFVLPSTSPANAAVPYDERLRWFNELARLAGAFGSFLATHTRLFSLR